MIIVEFSSPNSKRYSHRFEIIVCMWPVLDYFLPRTVLDYFYSKKT
jgi:hypothetical protein